MEMKVTQLGNVKKIALAGRLDLLGAQGIDAPFTAQAAAVPARVMVDLSRVDFMASVGLRILLTAAKAQKKLGGGFVLFGANAMIGTVLVNSGVSLMVPVAADEAAALAAAQA